MQQDKPARDTLPIFPESDDVSIFREEAIKHHFGDSESIGMVYRSARWPWAVLVLSILLVVAASVFVCTARLDVVERTDGLVYVDDSIYAAQPVSDHPASSQSTSGDPLVIAFLSVEQSATLHLGDPVQVAARNAIHSRSTFMSGHLARIKEWAPAKIHGAQAASVQIEIELRVPPHNQTRVAVYNGMPVTVHVTLKQQRLIDSVLSSFQRRPR